MTVPGDDGVVPGIEPTATGIAPLVRKRDGAVRALAGFPGAPITAILQFHGLRESLPPSDAEPPWWSDCQHRRVQAYWESLTLQERGELEVPAVLLSLEGIADAVFRLIANDTLAGRLFVWWNGQPPQLILAGRSGYVALEPFR